MNSLSIILPVLDEADGIADALSALAPIRQRGAEVIVVDGGSRDSTMKLAMPLADTIINAPRGRGAQMNAGAALARADVLLFLHGDTRLPPKADTLIVDALRQSGMAWGRFDIRIDGHLLLTVVALAMNFRSCLSGIATGDQAMFVTRAAFQSVGGFPDIALMEDVALSRSLKKVSSPLCLRARVVASDRRWQRHGLLRTILLMWRLRLAFFLGVRPAALARRYGYVPREN
jgi:rSAM/selenodomain-associated transferase 2